MTSSEIVIKPVSGKAGRAAFVDLGRQFAASVPHAVPQLRSELLELVNPNKNPFFGHADAQLFIAYDNGQSVGRISAHIDKLGLEMSPEQGFGPGTGNFGYFDARDERVGHALLARAEAWLRDKGMTRVLGPISMSIWEEPGLLVHGHDHSPMIMMGHDPAHYQGWIESAGYAHEKSLRTYDIDIKHGFPPLVQRIVKSGQRNERIHIRQIDKKRWSEDVLTVLHILNDAWSDNWGFIPFTPDEIAYAGKKLKPVIHSQINYIAELDGRPVAFMMTLPDVNHVLKRINGKLLPFGWVHMLRWLRNPAGSGMRVPLMGVLKELHNSRIASQLAFMMVEQIRVNAMADFDSQRAEMGWILDDNQGMVAITEAIGSDMNREYVIYQKSL